MRVLRDLSIKRKLIGIIMLTSMVALLLACGTFVAYELINYRKTITDELSTVAQIISTSSTAALAFNDTGSAAETLGVLRAEPHVACARIYGKDGRVIASYLRSGEQPTDWPARSGPDGAQFVRGHLVLYQPVIVDRERLGTVYLKRDLQDMYMRLERYAGIVLMVLLVASLSAFLLSSMLQRVISEPVLRLTEVASRVSAEGNYRLRATRTGDDEIGVLVDRFNEMLGQIESRKEEIQQAKRVLQRHVEELCNEIRERQRIQEELLAAKQAAEESNRAKSTFLANMSHELRTPLNAIIGYSEMLQEDAEEKGDSAGIADLVRIHSAGKHLLVLINDVLDLSKIEAGRTELLLEDLDVAQILEDAVSTMEPLARKNGNRLVVRYGEGLQGIRADLAKLRQSLYNLLSNACKFTSNGTITLEVMPVETEGRKWVEWRVSDTGIGIAEDQRGKLFRAFSQVDASTTRKYGGTGLGLAISQRFCQLMGGEITVVSELGRGSTFTIRLPQWEGGRKVERSSPPELHTAIGPQLSGQKHVLVIDDDPAVHDIMERSLGKQGFKFIGAFNGEEGLRKAREMRPAAIALDVLMPGMDGWAVLSALKADPATAGIPVILHTITDNQRLGYALGAAEYLQKPLDSERFMAALKKCASGKLAVSVLVVDDDPAARTMVSRALGSYFSSVVEAPDAASALQIMARQKPGLILLDLVMPGMDGFDFIKVLRQTEDWQKIPIVVLTAKDLSAEERQRLTGAVRTVVQKCGSGDDLARTLCDVVRTHGS